MAALKNKRHEKFLSRVYQGMNAKQAAIRTGYSEKTAKMQGSRLMTNDDVKARVAELRDAYFNEKYHDGSAGRV